MNAARVIPKSGNPVAAVGRFLRDAFSSLKQTGDIPARASLLARPPTPVPGAPGRSPLRVRAEGEDSCDDDTPRLVNEGGQWADVCVGYAYSLVETWEPAAFVLPVEILNRTFNSVNWSRTGGEINYSVWKNQSCWANPWTFILTTWYQDACEPTGSQTPAYYDSALTGLYHNDDFLRRLMWVLLQVPYPFDARIYTTHTASVQALPGWARWDYQYIEDATGWGPHIQYLPLFLSGVVSGTSWENCTVVCQPSSQQWSACEAQGGSWNYEWCGCYPMGDPLLIDLDRNGFALTNAPTGVPFDLRADGSTVLTAWTQAGSQDAFLVLDRNSNGRIDDGAELFSDVAPQPNGPQKQHKNGRKVSANGFLALSVFDEAGSGGDGDGQITEDDAIYNQLRLWLDTNHNGISEQAELVTLASRDIRSISLHFVASKVVDEFGNRFAYKSHVLMDSDMKIRGSLERNATDVFFQYVPLTP